MDRLPPNDKPAEMGLLGAVMRNPEVLPNVRATIRPESFYFDAHQKIFDVVCSIVDRGMPVSLVTVHSMLAERSQVDDIGGPQYLAELWDNEPTGINANAYADLVRECATLRAGIHAATELLRDLYDRSGPAVDVLAAGERRLSEIGADSVGIGELRPVGELLNAELARIDQRRENGGSLAGIATGYSELDHHLGGMRPGQLIVVGGRPSVGKTALGLNILVNAANSGTPVLFFSIEMPETEIGGRLLSMGSGVPMHVFTRGNGMSSEDAGRLIEAASMSGLGGCAIYIDDASSQTASRMLQGCRRAVRRHGIQLAVVDYLQLMNPENPKDNRTQQVGLAARRMKQAARECGIPILLLSQLNRDSENRGRPRLSDLRESGEIEQHADVVLLLHADSQPSENETWSVDVIVAKNRNGPIGDVHLNYRRPVMRFETPLIGPQW